MENQEQAQALINNLEAQRNQAMNQVAQVAAQLDMANAKIAELEAADVARAAALVDEMAGETKKDKK